MISTREDLAGARRWVVKIGSALLTADGRGLDRERLAGWAAQIAALQKSGCQVVLVSSGAVAEGLVRLGWRERPSSLSAVQAAASVGQAGLAEAYARCFETHGLRTAQVLLTHEDVSDRRRYLNARSTLMTLLGLGVVPIVNENDAIATDEIRVGDNDTMAALAVNLLDADGLIILTDQSGVYDADPRQVPDAKRIGECDAHDAALLAAAAGTGGALGRGGMRTKVLAARQAADSGAATIIADGLAPDVLARIMGGESIGTLLTPGQGARRAARKNWIAGQRQVRGSVHLDAGAVKVLRSAGRSLLPIGITAVDGNFRRGDLVACIGPAGEEIAQGLANYDAKEVRQLVGQSSDQIEALLGYGGDAEFIHRNNLVLSREG
ncbi:glutamate 5-kinase [uncultured Salinisphaera sp.]|uniref:glutamate 5-kinase n=1 Tax=uncultured Salinisphaera sp. TaxID=359372 RepID=UPI0032B20933